MWVSRDGRAEPVDSIWKADFHYPALSPRGDDIAVSISEGTTHLWIRRANGTVQRVTQDGVVNWRPSWASDGKSLFFPAIRTGRTEDDFNFYRVPVDVSEPPRLVRDHRYGIWEGEVTPDQRWFVFRTDEPGPNGRIGHVYAQALGADTTLVPLGSGGGWGRTQIAVSPDGRRVAFVQRSPSRDQDVNVVERTAGSAPRVVSRGGGLEPRWSRDGRELYYRSHGLMMSVPVTQGPRLEFGNPRPLFSTAPYRTARNRPEYDVAPDGRFLMIRELSNSDAVGVMYVENWLAELKEKVGR